MDRAYSRVRRLNVMDGLRQKVTEAQGRRFRGREVAMDGMKDESHAYGYDPSPTRLTFMSKPSEPYNSLTDFYKVNQSKPLLHLEFSLMGHLNVDSMAVSMGEKSRSAAKHLA
ncbi:hypothetical protein EYF80_008216 [Liparis tanakae]|uniref:Uncharacterized protein n=1 Tax=Liparis tanakae TaxID=230148 RepID=A0A4Z2IV96_9TELE|nr:hypothetical protein EYF80_008216 [Liparis tanakae]